MYDITKRFGNAPTRVMLILALLFTAACEDRPARLAMLDTQPKAPAQRNHTNFYPALQCMDNLFLKAKRPRVLISANQLPDKTRSISVDTRGMVITALNHMTRRSKAFAFVEQGIVGRTVGDTLALEKDNPKDRRPPTPRLYVNGTVSQIDSDSRGSTIETKLSEPSDGESVFKSGSVTTGIDHSVVTLDLHLVSFPSRIVIPGSAVSNSITVSRKRWGSGLAGLISQRTLGITLQIDTVESRGQAVRSLIELGLIEMLGNYTGVPFWECLSLTDAVARDTARDERAHIGNEEGLTRLKAAQETLNTLGYTLVMPTGQMDQHTRDALSRFQAQQGILANGVLDFDTHQALEKARLAMRPKPTPRPTRTTQPRTSPQTGADGYQSLQVFIDNTF